MLLLITFNLTSRCYFTFVLHVEKAKMFKEWSCSA